LSQSVTSSLNARYYPQHSLRKYLRFVFCLRNLVISFYTCMKSEAKLHFVIYIRGRSRWPRGLMRRSATARMLGSRVRILLRTWMFVSCICCVGIVSVCTVLCDESRPSGCVSATVCGLRTSTMKRSRAKTDCCAK
jgi:hypothetical protein